MNGQKQTAYLVGLRRGTSKKTGENYFIGFAALEGEKTATSVGYPSDLIKFYPDEAEYNKLYNTYKPFMPIELTYRVGTDRVYWNLTN